MNRSGEPVRRILSFSDGDTASLLVVHDDMDLPFGRLRLRVGGGAGGHRGIASILEQLGDPGFARLKIGVGRPPEGVPAEAWVLQEFGTAERGGGKRCKDEVRLMVVAPTGNDIAGAEVRMLSIPPGSLKNWGKYVSRLADMGVTFRSVMTEVSVEPYKGAYQIQFNPVGKLSEDAYLALRARRESATEQSMQPYPVLEESEKPKRPAKSNKKID
jgi:hypothetical protein